MEKFEKNITKRGSVPETTVKKGNDYPVGPVLLGFFVFVVIGSCKITLSMLLSLCVLLIFVFVRIIFLILVMNCECLLFVWFICYALRTNVLKTEPIVKLVEPRAELLLVRLFVMFNRGFVWFELLNCLRSCGFNVWFNLCNIVVNIIHWELDTDTHVSWESKKSLFNFVIISLLDEYVLYSKVPWVHNI